MTKVATATDGETQRGVYICQQTSLCAELHTHTHMHQCPESNKVISVGY